MNNKLFEIEILNIHWLENVDEEIDQCAHGQVMVRVGNEIIVDRSIKDYHWTLSAMALHLMRTTESNHNTESLVGDHLIPCCGFHIDHIENENSVYIQGCFSGVNFWVNHKKSNIELTTINGTEILISKEQYTYEIMKFVDEVKAFYDSSKPKLVPEQEYDRIGIEKFWKEWDRLRNLINKKMRQ